MLLRPTETHLRALASLATTPVWFTVEAMLKEDLRVTMEKIVASANIAELRNLQGRAKWLTEFLKAVEDAPSDLKKVVASATARP